MKFINIALFFTLIATVTGKSISDIIHILETLSGINILALYVNQNYLDMWHMNMYKDYGQISRNLDGSSLLTLQNFNPLTKFSNYTIPQHALLVQLKDFEERYIGKFISYLFLNIQSYKPS